MCSITYITVIYVFKSEISHVIAIHRPAGGVAKNIPYQILVRLWTLGLQSLVTCLVQLIS